MLISKPPKTYFIRFPLGESPLRSPSKVEVTEKKPVILSDVRGSPGSGSEFWTHVFTQQMQSRMSMMLWCNAR